MRLQPLFDRVIVRRVDQASTTAAGLVIPTTADHQPVQGEVVALGFGKLLDSGEIRAPTVSLGDRVLLEPDEGTEIQIDGKPLIAIKEKHIICIVKT